ncbi:DNA-binding MarR family transcriptional regulator/GNAT superfamily N-acetyltransferase [Paenibacillus phyllosphaerae]|uniref:DNA-binding MarR family transcriptional regulator/GNAT superfamily N-acetyltransferase n=1 Tax=Paenibacillus phyllosphaerae TaxID=274593 RepID=A0A7W5B1M8_9BACL|nr:helix-turn-helix domain-containing GNAT family N-acetyltransferase [Paenibacillus phyllosphaerae]MBB3112718.1 DNA-binding MarR family transcriptional regulator/GNAT superfamily N-acetyltransferase [Paenibacillus phyllosphaerae]
MSLETSLIPIIRKFNRFYTNVLGLLDKHLLDSDFSLSEVRVLYEIGHADRCTAKMLIDLLKIDAGYLSRILKRFEKLGLTYRVQSEADGRSSLLYLSKLGEETLSTMNALSDVQIRHMIAGLPERSQKSIAASMSTIERELSDHPSGPDIRIRSELQPGDAGMLIHMHGWIYAQECGYNHVFEGYVCKTFYDVLLTYSPDRDRFWLAEADGQIVGSIAIIGQSEGKAQLRWFMLHPDYRGLGLGKKLLHEAISYCRARNIRQLFLETTQDQKTAIGMYAKAGFQKVAERENQAWGIRNIEETYELHLHGGSPHEASATNAELT